MTSTSNGLSSGLDRSQTLEDDKNFMWRNERMVQLERHILDWRYDMKYKAIIDDLCQKIKTAIIDNSGLLLMIDSIKLAREDFKIKFENEMGIRLDVEADVAGLRKIQGDLTVCCCNLKMEAKSLNDELFYMTRHYEEMKKEMEAWHSQISSNYMNKMDAKSQKDLNRTMNEISSEYEGIIEKDLRNLEAMSKDKLDKLNKEMASSSETLHLSQSDKKKLKRTLQALEIELQTQLSLKCTLEGKLGETEGHCILQRQRLQTLVDSLEIEINRERADIESQTADNQTLLDINDKLKLEATESKKKLEVDETKASAAEEVTKTTCTATKKVIIVEEIVD